MPLPFLTADRAFDTTDHVALPFDDHDQWRRPYRPGSWRVGAAALALLLASFVLLAAVIIVAAGGFAAAGVTLALAVLVILAALRMLRVGTWVSRAGVRRVGFLRTSTVPWAKVTSVRTVQQPVRWLGLPRTVQGQALVLGRQGGEQLLLLTDHNADFLSRVEAFDRAADTVEAWNAEYGVVPATTR
ncbi:PH domain-containing protein [Streptomyces gardneri]|uniref:Membrane protein n=1 Tax=Streptomyces gardneri TaxID=66892 RepID=A0A4Y3RVS1_9ACTN|nr:PH domain-containing protein [Streptomyces gardneri]GEB60833.1 membrane protein [Streptomyces gardneri]GHH15426.1 membrane protein [Streptomyces gardneri]